MAATESRDGAGSIGDPGNLHGGEPIGFVRHHSPQYGKGRTQPVRATSFARIDPGPTDTDSAHLACEPRCRSGARVPAQGARDGCHGDRAARVKLCGWTLARAHARSGDATMIAGYVGTSPNATMPRSLTPSARAASKCK